MSLEAGFGRIIAEPRFGLEGGWRLPTRLPDTVRLEARKYSALAVSLATTAELGDAIVPAAWAEGVFVDVEVEATIRFEAACQDAAAGFWLRAGDDATLSVMSWPDGAVSVAGREGEKLGGVLARASPPARFDGARGVRLGARLRGDLLEVFFDGQPLVSATYPWDDPGRVELRVQVGQAPTQVVFVDATARLAD